MLVAQIGLACGLAMVSPDGDIAFRVEEWLDAEVVSVTEHQGRYEPWYEAEIVDADGYTYILDDIDADWYAEAEWMRNGQVIQITVDDGCIEDIRG